MITQATTKSIAHAAKLSLTEEEVILFTKDLQEIIKAFTILDTVETSTVKPSFLPIPQKNVLREDFVRQSITQEEALRLTKQHENGFFIGPRTVD